MQGAKDNAGIKKEMAQKTWAQKAEDAQDASGVPHGKPWPGAICHMGKKFTRPAVPLLESRGCTGCLWGQGNGGDPECRKGGGSKGITQSSIKFFFPYTCLSFLESIVLVFALRFAIFWYG